jgi:hypothetical protein
MVTEKRRRKRNHLALLLLPALIFIFFMGWTTYWIGDTKRPKAAKQKAQKPKPKQDNITFLPAVLEETPKIVNE